MATFQLDAAAEMSLESRRILGAQAREAIAALSGEDRRVGVHEARKACKRGRALLRLVRSGLASKPWRALDRGLQRAARAIGPLRDAHVVGETLRTVAGDVDGLVWKVPGAPEQPDLAVADAIVRLRRTVDLVEATDFDAVGVEAVIEGLQRSWRDARGAMMEAADVDDAEVMHDWRKTAKRAFYHVQLLGGLWPPVVGALVGELDVLQETLGSHHDLAVVASVVDRERSSPSALAELDGTLRRRAETLRSEALACGRLVFAPPPKTVGALVEAIWAARR